MEFRDFFGHRSELSDADISFVNSQLTRGLTRRDAVSIRQGRIGDCYLIAAIMAILSDARGREHVTRSVAPYYADGRQAGFVVRLGIRPRDMIVTQYLTDGARQRGRVSLVSVLEAAYAEFRRPWTVRRGFAYQAMSALSGVRPQLIVPDCDRTFTHKHRAQLEAMWSRGTPLAAETWPTAGIEWLGGGYHFPLIDTPTGHNRVKIVPAHAYVVSNVDASGLTLINPHGRNRAYDGSRVPAEIGLSWEPAGEYLASLTALIGYHS